MFFFQVWIIVLFIIMLFNFYYDHKKTTSNDDEFNIVTRLEWNATPVFSINAVMNAVPYVIIHHSFTPGECHTQEQCANAMQSIQNYHREVNKWNDIGYNFGVGGDGRAYQGRGWGHVGAHAPNYNSQSIGICLIGDWRYTIPPESQLEVTKKLIKYGIDLGFIQSNYTLYGHRQVRNTECPGDALYKEIQTWEHYSSIVTP